MHTTPGNLIRLGLVLGASLLAGCGTDTDGDSASGRPGSVVERAPAYVGDPWEQRFREQFWIDRHVHDSWNPCRVGENAPKARQGSGPACWSLLRSHTGR